MTGSSLAGIIGAGAGVITALALLLGAMPAFMKMRHEIHTDRLEATEDRIKISAQLGIIHTLTNATLSAAYEATLGATKRELVMMREVGRMHIENGQEPSNEWRTAIGELEGRVADLTLLIEERRSQTFTANLQVAHEERRQLVKEHRRVQTPLGKDTTN